MRRILGVRICRVPARRIIRPMRGLPPLAVMADFHDFPVARPVTAQFIPLPRSTGTDA